MLLSYENIAHYLLEKGLIDLESIVDGKFSVREQSSRNVNFAVNREYEPAYLVKQVRAREQEKRETLRTEATCYWLAANDENYRPLYSFLPRYHEYDYLNHILILELLPEVRNLHEYYYETGIFPVEIAEMLADMLASYHTHSEGDLKDRKSFALFRKRKPWVFTLGDQNLADWIENPALGQAEKQSVRLILENGAFMEHLRGVNADWETKSLLHGDVKFPNFLIGKSTEADARPNIRLIDWELADIGDPLWDVAAVIQNYLNFWVASEIIQQDSRRDDAWFVPLEQVQPSIEAFWRRYASLAGWNDTDARRCLEKTVRYTALKLVHTCFESVQGVKDLPLYSAKILQLSLNLLQRPDEAIWELLGIQIYTPDHATPVLYR